MRGSSRGNGVASKRLLLNAAINPNLFTMSASLISKFLLTVCAWLVGFDGGPAIIPLYVSRENYVTMLMKM